MDTQNRSLPDDFARRLINSAETGMGYQIVSVILHDGTRFDRVVVLEGSQITSVDGHTDWPFSSTDIAEVVLTHDKSLA